MANKLWELAQSVWVIAALRAALIFRRHAFVHGALFGVFAAFFAFRAAALWLPIPNEVVADIAVDIMEAWVFAWPMATLVTCLYLLLTSPFLIKDFFAAPSPEDK